MVMITVKKCLVRTSVSVLAVAFSASLALAEGDEVIAGNEVDVAMTVPEVIVCELYPGPVETVDTVAEPEVTIDDVAEGEIKDPGLPSDTGGEDPLVYYMSAGGSPETDMVARPVRAMTRGAQARDPAAVPNLCDVAGPGLDWLCAAQAR